MDLKNKLNILADAAKYDASCASSGSKSQRDGTRLGTTEDWGICHSYTPDGRCVSLLKILLTNFCIFDCRYCVNRVSSDTPRARFTVEEVVTLTLDFYRRNYIEGLFLSSGIIQNSDYTMEQLVRVARELRQTHEFGGYIHLKTIPGASEQLIREAGRWADRLSVNIELPTAADLEQLAPEKKLPEIEGAMTDIQDEIASQARDRQQGMKTQLFAPAGQTTQMIIGATASSDHDILKTADRLYQHHQLRRVYYSAFSPIPFADSRLPPERPPLIREHRLYQADRLMRFYGFGVDELTTPENPNLDLAVDPKTAWALLHRELFPVDVNKAPRELLVKIPGVGVRNCDRILKARKFHSLSVADLKRLRIAWKKAQHFLIASDHIPRTTELPIERFKRLLGHSSPRQLSLFDKFQPSTVGEH